MTLQKTTRDFVKHSAQKMGISLDFYPPPGSFRRQLRDLLAQKKINVVLDVGAYIGNYAAELRDIGYQGKIISFEPVPASYDKLQARMGHDPLWSAQPFGLSDENREAVMNTFSRGDFNSLLSLRTDSERAYSLDPSSHSQTTIQLRRLDLVLPQLLERVQSPSVFLKIDTQGHDLSVVRGATGVLNHIEGLQSELPAVQIYDGMASMTTVLDYYFTCGFVPIGFHPVNTMRGTQISPEFDVLFSRFEGSLIRP
jgi:FkbM family methyltransferase